jgi:hypothetical protein
VGPRAGLYGVEKRKFLTLPGLELRPPVASRYTDCAIPVPCVRIICKNIRDMDWINLAQNRDYIIRRYYEYDHGYIKTWEFLGQEGKHSLLNTDFALWI